MNSYYKMMIEELMPEEADYFVQLYKDNMLRYFHGESKSAIFQHLKECFPGKIKFGYVNFTQYYD